MADYFIANDNQREGPYPEEELLQNGLRPDTLVWRSGMANWQPASNVPELAQYLSASSQVPQIPQVPQSEPVYEQNDQNAPYSNDDDYSYSQLSSSNDDDKDSGSGCGSWAIYIGILLFINLLSYIFDWSFWIY